MKLFLKIQAYFKQDRHVNLLFDSQPSIHHLFNFKISRNYITNKVVLDIGCWTGQFEKLAKNITKRIVGIDTNNKAIQIAQKTIPNVQFKIGNALNIKFPKNSFDTVLLLEVIEHLPKNSEKLVLKEIKKILKPNGYLILSTPNKNLLSILLDPAFLLENHRHYSLSEITKILNTNGFKVINSYKTGGIMRLLWENIQLFGKHILNTKINQPTFVKHMIENEYYLKGFAQLHIISKRTS